MVLTSTYRKEANQILGIIHSCLSEDIMGPNPRINNLGLLRPNGQAVWPGTKCDFRHGL